mgnify:CR=1 FL=1
MSTPGKARAARPTDLPAIAAILDAVWLELDQPICHTVEELNEEFSSEATSLDDVLVWESADGELIGVGYTVLLPGESLARCYLFGGVLPEWRSRGVGGSLIDQLIDRAERRLHGCSSDRRVIRTHRPSSSISAARLLRSRDFSVVRYFTDMHREVNDSPAALLPDGYRIGTWDPSRSEEIRLLKNLAFNDHWGSTPSSTDSLLRHVQRLLVSALETEVAVRRNPRGGGAAGQRGIERHGAVHARRHQARESRMPQRDARRHAPQVDIADRHEFRSEEHSLNSSHVRTSRMPSSA